MRYTDKAKLKKSVVFLTIAVLITVSGAAIDWNSPEDGENFDEDVFLSLDTSSVQGNIQNITLEVEGPNQDDYGHFKEVTQDSGDNYTVTFDKGQDADGTHGDYKFRARAYNGTGPNETTSSRTLTLDGKAPEVDSFSPSDNGYTNEDGDLDVSYSASDTHSEVDYQNISISSENESSNSDNLDDLSLSEGDYTVDYWVNDTVGNVKQGDWEFTVDTEYDGDTDPKFSPSSDNIFTLEDDDDDQAFDVTFDEADSESDTKVKCYDGSDDRFDSTDYKDVEDDGTAFTCEIDADDYTSSKVEVYVDACDRADNCEKIDQDITYYMDLEAPDISSLTTTSGASSFNSNFDISFSASDDASGLETVEYYFDSNVDNGDGTSIDYSSDKESYEIDVSGLESGDKTLYLRAKDKADRWSSVESLEFDYYPNKDPEISLTTPEELKVMSGNSKEFRVSVENTGDLFIGSTNLSYSSDLSSSSVEITELAKGDIVNQNFNIQTDEADIGSYKLDVATDKPPASKQIDVRVEANEDQKDRINSSFSDLKKRFNELESNVTDLRSDVSGENEENLLYNFSNINKTMSNAEKALEEGKYYEVQAAIEKFDSEFKQAAQSYVNVKEEYKSARRMKIIFLVLGALIIALIGVLAYIVHENKYEIDLSGYELDLSGLKTVDDIEVKVKSLLEGGDEAEEFEWDGFDDN